MGEYLKEFTIRRLIKLSAWTHEDDIRENFIPYFRTFLKEAKLGGRDPETMGEALVKMHKFLLNHSFRKTFKSAHVWKAFLEEMIEDELYSNARISYMTRIRLSGGKPLPFVRLKVMRVNRRRKEAGKRNPIYTHGAWSLLSRKIVGDIFRA